VRILWAAARALSFRRARSFSRASSCTMQITREIEARRGRFLSRSGCARIAALRYILPKRPG